MYMIENLKRMLFQTNKIKGYIELASKIHCYPPTRNSAKALDEILGMIHKRVDHLCNQLEKGIAIEKELDEIDAMTKDLPGAEIHVFPSVCNPDPPVLPLNSKN